MYVSFRSKVLGMSDRWQPSERAAGPGCFTHDVCEGAQPHRHGTRPDQPALGRRDALPGN